MTGVERRIVLLRHAKAEPDDDAGDHERRLSERGRREAARVGARLVASGLVPDVVWSSDARRTRETWAQIAPMVGDVAPSFVRSLYLCGFEAVRAAARVTPATARTVWLIGHNPGWEQAVGWWTGEPVAMGTANAAVLGATGDWASAVDGPWALIDVVRPE